MKSLSLFTVYTLNTSVQGSIEGQVNHDLVSAYRFRNAYERPQTQAARNNLQR